MEKKVIISAKTTEEAISKAVEELGAPSADAVKVTVLEADDRRVEKLLIERRESEEEQA